MRVRQVTHLPEIRSKISSDDPDILEYCLIFTKECMEEEKDRGKAFETKAGGILAILGILTGLVVPVTARFHLSGVDFFGKETYLILFIIFVAFVLFLIKAIWYAIKVVRISRTSKTYRFTPEAVYQFQSIDILEVKRKVISHRIHIYPTIVKRNTEKAYYLQRSHRNSAISIAIYLVFGSIFLSDTTMLPSWILSSCFTYALLSTILVVFFFLDPILEKVEGIFTR